MKKFSVIALALIAALALSSCDDTSGKLHKSDASDAPGETSPVETALDSITEPQNTAAGENDIYTLGELTVVDNSSKLQLQSVRLKGTQQGDDADGISSFYLGDEIEFFVESNYSNAKDGKTVLYAVPHSTTHNGSYAANECAFAFNFDDGSFLQNTDKANFSNKIDPEFWDEGCYDLVFTYDGSAVAYMVIDLLPPLGA